MPDFDCFSKNAFSFLKDLKTNNNKEWFSENKTTYDQEVKEPARVFSNVLSDALSAMTGKRQSAKIYRIYRDVRFSKDKRPYNTHVHISFAHDQKNPNAPMWFFGWDPDGLTLGCGVFQYGKDALDQYRTIVAGPKGHDLASVLNDASARGMRVAEPALKRVPNGFDKDHPNRDMLRRKGVSVWRDLADPELATESGLIDRCMNGFKELDATYAILSEIEQSFSVP